MANEISQFLSRIKQIRERQIEAARKAVDQFGEHVIGDAQQITPVATGFLQGSGTTEPAIATGTEIKKTIGFNAHYAAAVHEKLNVNHSVGGAKFLELAMQRNAGKFGDFVATRIKAAGG